MSKSKIYDAPGSTIAGMEIQVFQNENSSQTNAYLHYSNYSYSGLIPNERALNNQHLPIQVSFDKGIARRHLTGNT